MVSWSGRRKYFTILMFIAPTILGLLLVSVYPMFYNVFISSTNRGATSSRAPCEKGGIYKIMDPTCWIENDAPKRAQPYKFHDPIYKNYQKIFQELVSATSLTALFKILLFMAPFAAAWIVVRRIFERKISSQPTWWIWLLGIGGSALSWVILDVNGSINHLMDTGDFFVVMFRTVLYVIACIPLFFVIGLALAMILNSKHLKARAAWRVLLIVPWAMQAYIAALVWQFFFRTEQGFINTMLYMVGIDGPAWLQQANTAFFAVVLVNVWMSYPFFMVVILGALQSIPQEQYEAADVDGANWWDKLTRITLPLLRPAIMPAVVLSSITTFQMFNTVYMITAGGPTRGAGKPGATELVMVYAYKQFQAQAYGKIGAFAVIIFIVLFVATLMSLRITQVTKGAYE